MANPSSRSDVEGARAVARSRAAAAGATEPDGAPAAPAQEAPGPASDRPAVRVRGLTKTFGGFTAVDDIDLDIERGICFGLLGPNGAGKTTAIRAIDCTTPPTSGEVTVLGMDALRERRGVKARLGVVPQEDNLDPDFSVYRNLITYARFFHVPRKTAEARAARLLTFMQLDEKRDAQIPFLSGGMKRRLIVARALMNDPDLLMLDEPTTGLDPQARHSIWDKIRALKREGKTVLLTTHYMDEAEALCDRLVIMDQGKVLAEGHPRTLIQEHTGGEAVEFVVPYGKEDVLDTIAKTLDDEGVRHERLSDRILAYSDDAAGLRTHIQETHEVSETVIRRATLEDVFLRITGRALRD